MAQFRYKAKLTDDIEDAKEMVRTTGKMLMEGKIDKKSAIDNLARAFRKLESARYFIDRS